VCAVERRRFPVGVSPIRRPLQPEATGAVMEVTKWLKPSVSVSRIGDSASVQAVTRVNAEQALYGAFEVKHLFHGILPSFQFLCSTWNPVSSPRPAVSQSRRAQELSRLAVAPTLRHTVALPGHTLTASSTTACLMRSGRRSEGSLPSGRGSSRHNLVFGRSIAT